MTKTYLFYHHDLDGKGAGAIWERSLHKNKSRGDKMFSVDYIKDLHEYTDKLVPGDTAVFVDYSFTEINLLMELSDRGVNILWIDHHKSSTELQEKYPEFLETIPGIRDKRFSGAMLTWMYAHYINYFSYSRNDAYLKLEDIAAGTKALRCGDMYEWASMLDIPMYVRMIDDHDRWQFKIYETKAFVKGMDAREHGYEPDSTIWDHIDLEMQIDMILQIGTTILAYTNKEFEEYRKKAMFVSEIAGIPCAVVNRKCNSEVFGEEYHKYRIVCTFFFTGEVYSYSIYSWDKTVDCAAIAESYGGGGSLGAAGFKSDKLIFDKREA